MRQVALFLNGEKPKIIPSVANYDYIVCTDGAYCFLREVGIAPNLITGDFDSIQALPDGIPHIYTPNPDFTDFEKAIKIIIDKGYQQVDVFAANGLEQDHFLGNMTTALKYHRQINITFFDDRQSYYFIEKNIKLKNVKNKVISLFPFPKAKNITTKGLKYPIKGGNLNILKSKIGTRNIAIKRTVKIKFSKGHLLVFIAR